VRRWAGTLDKPPRAKRPPKKGLSCPMLRRRVVASKWHATINIGIASMSAVLMRGLRKDVRVGGSISKAWGKPEERCISLNGPMELRKARRERGGWYRPSL